MATCGFWPTYIYCFMLVVARYFELIELAMRCGVAFFSFWLSVYCASATVMTSFSGSMEQLRLFEDAWMLGIAIAIIILL